MVFIILASSIIAVALIITAIRNIIPCLVYGSNQGKSIYQRIPAIIDPINAIIILSIINTAILIMFGTGRRRTRQLRAIAADAIAEIRIAGIAEFTGIAGAIAS